MKKRCVLSFADGKYKNGLKRLEDSVRAVGFDGDILFWYDELPPGSPTHDESPCGFKIFAFLEAKRRGYDSALWIDATGIAVRDLTPIFKGIESDGYYLMGPFISPVGEWSADATLKNFGISREEALKIPELLTFVIGLDLNDATALAFLEEYRKKAVDGISFRGAPRPVPIAHTLNNQDGALSPDTRVKGHRWEQTNASIIAHKMGMRHHFTHRSYDIIGHAPKGEKYATLIPADALLVQNRDIKYDDYLRSIDRWGNRKGLARIPYLAASIALAVARRAKNSLRILSERRFDLSLIRIIR